MAADWLIDRTQPKSRKLKVLAAQTTSNSSKTHYHHQHEESQDSVRRWKFHVSNILNCFGNMWDWPTDWRTDWPSHPQKIKCQTCVQRWRVSCCALPDQRFWAIVVFGSHFLVLLMFSVTQRSCSVLTLAAAAAAPVLLRRNLQTAAQRGRSYSPSMCVCEWVCVVSAIMCTGISIFPFWVFLSTHSQSALKWIFTQIFSVLFFFIIFCISDV